MIGEVVSASGALVFTVRAGRDGHGLVLRASTAGGVAELPSGEAARVGAELLQWSRDQAVSGGCTASGSCPRHPDAQGLHDPAFAERQVAS